MHTPVTPNNPFAAAVCVSLTLSLLATAPARAADDWKFDVVHLKNGRSLQGLLIEKNTSEIQFCCVSRKAGSHTVVIPTTLKMAEVDYLDLLEGKDREVLSGRLKALDPTGKGEAQRMASLEFKVVAWGKDGKTKALSFPSTHFTLESNAPEDIVRRAAVQLEQIYAAYTRFLPPRYDSGEPTVIRLAQSLADYQALLREQGRTLLNPAFYDTARNQIVCGTELQQLGEQLERKRKDNQKLLEELKNKEAELQKIYQGKPPAVVLRPIQEARQQVDAINKQNDELFQAATRQLFRTLYHEAFHAYLANFVYPPAEAEVPRWLNEGLAQVFESAFIDAGELRVEQADKARLNQAQASLRNNDLVPIPDLLRAGPKQFVVLHASDQQTSDRYYLTSWGAAYYLTFERRLLGTKPMDNYVRALKRGTDTLEAFRELVGQTPGDFEKDLRDYLTRLRPDGSTAKTPPGK
jgi:hypothetical protein